MRHIVLHYHIFKNAGSTLDAVLKRNFNADWSSIDGHRLSIRLDAQDLLAYAIERPRLKAISSHQAAFSVPMHPSITFYPIIFLRHPIDRIGSIYFFEKSQPREITKSQTIARQNDMGGYIRWYLSNEASIVITNYQTAFLSSTTQNLHKFKSTTTDLKIALQKLNELSFVGLVDYFDESLLQMNNYLKGVFGKLDLTYTIENKSQNRRDTLQERLDEMEEMLGPNLFQEILEKNAFDLELYENAVKLLTTRSISDRDQLIVEKERIIAQQEQTIEEITREKREFYDVLVAIANSRSWKTILLLQRIWQYIIPPGSLQEKFIGFVFGVINRIVKAFRNLAVLIEKVVKLARTNGIKATILLIAGRFLKKKEPKYSHASLLRKYPKMFPIAGLRVFNKNVVISLIDSRAQKGLMKLFQQLELDCERPEVLKVLKEHFGVDQYYRILDNFFEYENTIEVTSRNICPLIQASQLPDMPKPLKRRNILFVTGQFPNPHHGGGNRILNFIKVLSENNDIYLATSYFPKEDDSVMEKIEPYCRSIYKIPFWQFGKNTSEILNWLSGRYMDIVHYEWPPSLENYDPRYGRYQIFTYMESVSLRILMDLKRHVPLSEAWLDKFSGLLHALQFEISEASKLDLRIAVTTKDAEFFQKLYPFQKYAILNHGVSFDEFSLPDVEPESNTLVFVGNYVHYPNTDAMLYFFNEIWPGILTEVPDVKIYLIGYTPPPELRRYEDEQHVIITGAVPDIRPYIQKATICIAPLITGAGLRGKVIDYAALQRTFVATSIAVTDLTFKDGIDYLKADTASDFAQSVIQLLKDKEMRQQLAKSAYNTALKSYDTRHLAEYLYRLYNSLERSPEA